MQRDVSPSTSAPEVNPRVFHRLVRWLSPWEAAMMHLQSLLVWEKTTPSLIFTAAIHIFFWYVALSNHGTYFVICLGLLIIVLLDLWKGCIWPEIKVPDEFDNEEGWVPVHARLLSIHDVSLIIAEQWALWSDRWCRFFGLRQNHPLLFCILSSSVLLTTAYLGARLSGTALVYLAFVVAMTLPCLIYHGILDAFKLQALPILQRIDQQLDEQGRLEDPHDASMQEALMCPSSERLRADIDKELRDSKTTGDFDSDDELNEFLPRDEVTLNTLHDDDLSSGFAPEEIGAALREGRDHEGLEDFPYG